MRAQLAGLFLLVACNAEPSAAAGALGAPKTTLDHKAPLDAKIEIDAKIDSTRKIVAPDMIQSGNKIVAPDMIQSGNKIVAPDMIQSGNEIVAPDMLGKTAIQPKALIGEDGSRPTKPPPSR